MLALTLWITSCSHPNLNSMMEIESAIFQLSSNGSNIEWEVIKPADTFLLVEVIALGTESLSSLYSSDDFRTTKVRLPYLRSAPSFMCAESNSYKERVKIEVQLVHTTFEAPLKLRAFALDATDISEQERIRGLRLLCLGLQSDVEDEHNVWEKAVNHLQKSAEMLDRVGEKRLSLWARYYSAYFQYYPLNRYTQALNSANSLLLEIPKGEMHNLRIVLHQLIGQVLLERDSYDSEEISRMQLEQAQQILQTALSLAEESNNVFEQAWALNNSGIAFYYQDLPSDAFRQHQKALNLISGTNDEYLINLFGGNLALTFEKQGEIQRALEAFKIIEKELNSTKSNRELMFTLGEQGRIYIKLHLYPEAISYLSKALVLAQETKNIEAIGRLSMFLGQSYREIGQFDKSDSYLELAIQNMEQSRYGRGLRDTHGLIADNNRQRGSYARVNFHRAKQAAYLSTDFDRANWFADSAKDKLAEGNAHAALDLFNQSQILSRKTQMQYVADLGLLQTCVLLMRENSNSDCVSQAKSAVESVRRLENPRLAFEGRRLWAEILSLEGKLSEAISATESLLEDITTYRRNLAGVLGAWYWENRSGIFHFYMNLQLLLAEKAGDATKSFLALQRIYNVNLTDNVSRIGNIKASEENTNVRNLIAKLHSVESEQEKLQVAVEIDQQIMSWSNNKLSSDQQDLSMLILEDGALDVSEESTLLAYYFASETIHIWTIADRSIQHHAVPKPADFNSLVNDIRNKLRTVYAVGLNVLLERLGDVLIEPIYSRLKSRVYVLSSGVLSGLPLEVVTVKNEPLLVSHEIINLMSFGSFFTLDEHRSFDISEAEFFIAGNPNLPGGTMPVLDATKDEMDWITYLFPFNAITAVAGEDLILEAFSSSRFKTASVIHIASHAEINPVYPELSKIILSGLDARGNPETFMPADLYQQTIQAGLVVLSACQIASNEGFEFDSGLGFVNEFLRAGANLVVASLWSVSDRETSLLMKEFYSELKTGADPTNALVAAKRKLLYPALTEGSYEWSAFQIYVD